MEDDALIAYAEDLKKRVCLNDLIKKGPSFNSSGKRQGGLGFHGKKPDSKRAAFDKKVASSSDPLAKYRLGM